jgi:flagellar protein FlaG
MLIQNINSATMAPRLASDSAPVAVAAPQIQATPVELPQTAVKAATETPAANNAPTQAHIQSAVDGMNKMMKQNDSGLEFSIDQDTKRTIIKLVESRTGDVIRQYPTEDMLAITRAIDQMQQHGVLLNQKA